MGICPICPIYPIFFASYCFWRAEAMIAQRAQFSLIYIKFKKR